MAAAYQRNISGRKMGMRKAAWLGEKAIINSGSVMAASREISAAKARASKAADGIAASGSSQNAGTAAGAPHAASQA